MKLGILTTFSIEILVRIRKSKIDCLFQGTVDALSRVVGEVGPSMFQSSVAQAITFSLGSLSSMPAIRVRIASSTI